MDKPATKRRGVLPRSVELRQGLTKTSLRISFIWRGERCRETLQIEATPANIKYAGKLVSSVELAIQKGTFDYAETFPNSKIAKEAAKVTKAKQQTVSDLIRTYIDTARNIGSFSPTTIITYARWYKSRLEPQFKDTPVGELTTYDLRTWINSLATELSPKSVRNCLGVLSVVLGQAHLDGLISSNPLKPIKLRNLLPRKKKNSESERVDPFNNEEISAILAACRTPEERVLFQFAFASGLRTGELIALKWSHINWQTGMILVQDNLVLGELGPVEKNTKTETDREVPLLPAALQALQAVKLLPRKRNMGDYIFMNPYNHRRWANSHQIRKCWVTTLAAANIRYRNPYQTRHTFASHLLAGGEQELLVSKLLGHASVEMVRRHYGKYIYQPNGILLRGDYTQFGAAPEITPPDKNKY